MHIHLARPKFSTMGLRKWYIFQDNHCHIMCVSISTYVKSFHAQLRITELSTLHTTQFFGDHIFYCSQDWNDADLQNFQASKGLYPPSHNALINVTLYLTAWRSNYRKILKNKWTFKLDWEECNSQVLARRALNFLKGS